MIFLASFMQYDTLLAQSARNQRIANTYSLHMLMATHLSMHQLIDEAPGAYRGHVAISAAILARVEANAVKQTWSIYAALKGVQS